MFLWFIMQCRKVKPWVLYACNFFYYYVQRCAVSKLADWRRVGYLNFISFSITVFYVSKLLSIINVLLNNWSFMRDIISKYMTFLSLLFRKNDWNLFPCKEIKTISVENIQDQLYEKIPCFYECEGIRSMKKGKFVGIIYFSLILC